MLAGRYEVGELIGRGGMAEVHIGRDNRLSRRVAIKLLRSDLAQDSTFQARFRREAQSAAALNHPAIVSVYDTGEDTQLGPDGTETHIPFIVMEYVEGHTVRELLRDGAALPIDEAVEITAGVLSALEYSHHAGIIHRDIKPANVMITTAGDVKVMDFGIARAVADSAATMTQTQAVVGTAQYLSPEQARGEVVDARSDVYSTGALLFELLTGRPPFVGDSPVAVAYQHVREEPPTPSSIAPDVPRALDRVVLKALAKDRTVRYQSAEEFRADLMAAQHGGVLSAPEVGVVAAADRLASRPASPPTAATQVLTGPPTNPTAATPPPPPQEPEGEERRSRAWIWVLVLIILVIAGGIAWAALGRDHETGEPETPTSTMQLELVPDVSGMTQAQATSALMDVGFQVTVENEPSVDVAKGLVVRSDPAAQVQLATGQTVTIYLSSGPDSVTVPNVISRTVEEAEAALTQAGFEGFNLRQVPVDSADFDAGQIVSIDPGVGAAAAPNASFVIEVATGNVAVPDLTGMTELQAQQALAAAKLTGAFRYVPNGDHDPGTVIRWEPSGTVKRLSTINVEIATEPTETATTPEPTPTQTPTPDPTESEPPAEGENSTNAAPSDEVRSDEGRKDETLADDSGAEQDGSAA